MSPIGIRKTGLENDIIQNSNIEHFDLEKIKCPTMIIHGKHDADVTLHHAGYLATNIPQAEKLIVEDGFHILPVSNSYMDVHKKRLAFLNKYRPY
jgi:pimeloyl-ACP methyl ester carboxylesterase